MKKILFLLSLVAVAFLGYYIFANPPMVMWDDGGYLHDGYKVFRALENTDWNLFWQTTRSQFYYPFFQSWILAGFGLAFGYGVQSARIASLSLLIPTIILIFFMGERIGKKVGVYASLFFLTSPLGLFFFSSIFKESLGLFLTTLTFFFYLLFIDKKRRIFALASGGILSLLFLTKYNYGVLPALIFALESLWQLILVRKTKIKTLLLDNTFLFILPVITVFWWVFTPVNNWSWLLRILSNPFNASLGQTGIFGYVSYYLFELASSYTFSQAFFLLILICFIFGLKNFLKVPKIRVLALFFLLNFILGILHFKNQQSRFIYTSIFSFFIIAASGVEKSIIYFKSKFKRPLFLGFVGVLLLVILGISLYDMVLWPSNFKPTVTHALDSAAWYETDFKETRYVFSKQIWPHTYQTQKETIEDVYNFVFDNIDVRKSIRQVVWTNELSQTYFDYMLDWKRDHLKTVKNDSYQSYVVTFKIVPGSFLDNYGYKLLSSSMEYQISQVENDKSLKKIDEKLFSVLGVKVAIYGY